MPSGTKEVTKRNHGGAKGVVKKEISKKKEFAFLKEIFTSTNNSDSAKG